MLTSAVSQFEYIDGVHTRLSQLWNAIVKYSLNSNVYKHWWTKEIYEVKQVLEQEHTISTALHAIREQVQPTIVWVITNIQGSGYDTIELIKNELLGLIEFIRLEPLATVEEEDETDDSRNQIDNSNAHAERLKKLEELLAEVRKLFESLDV